MAVTETLREAGQKRLLSALKQAQERLGDLSLISEASATFLETECFKKYGKVGKTFYNSQLAATVRWLSSASCEQIHDRLSANSTLAAGHCTTSYFPNVTVSPASNPHDNQNQEQTANEDTQGNAQLEDTCDPLQMTTTTTEKIELPPIPSFSEFANKKRNSTLLNQHPSRDEQKRPTNYDRLVKKRG